MRRTLFAFASLSIATTVLAAAGCSGSNEGPGNSSSSNSSSATSSATSSGTSSGATVSFSRDLVPLFQTNCSTATGGSCHGATNVVTQAQPRPYFGPYMIPLDAGDERLLEIYQGLVIGPDGGSVKSNEAPSLNYVTPGDPSSSFLWHKINGDLTSIASDCTNPVSDADPCGVQMPNETINGAVESALPQTQQNQIMSWIQANAPNN